MMLSIQKGEIFMTRCPLMRFLLLLASVLLLTTALRAENKVAVSDNLASGYQTIRPRTKPIGVEGQLVGKVSTVIKRLTMLVQDECDPGYICGIGGCGCDRSDHWICFWLGVPDNNCHIHPTQACSWI